MHNPYESPQVDPFMKTDGEAEVPEIVFIEPPRERLGWLHLLLWLAALVVMIYVQPDVYYGLFPYPVDLHFARNVGSAAFVAAGIAGLFLAAIRLWTKVATFPKFLGHWLLMVVGIRWIADRIIDAWVDRIRYAVAANPGKDAIEDPIAWIPQIQGLSYAVAAIYFTYLLWRAKPDKLWRRVVACAIAINVWFLACHSYSFQSISLLAGITLTLTIALALAYLMAIVRDLTDKKERDPLHWLGIATEICTFMPIVIYFNMQLVAEWISPPPLGY